MVLLCQLVTDSVLFFTWVVWVLHVVIHNTQEYNTMIMSLLYATSISITLIITCSTVILIFQGNDIYEEMTASSGVLAEVLGFMTWVLQYSRAVLFAIVIFNVIIYALPPEAKMIGFCLFLPGSMILIGLALVVLALKQFCGDMYGSFCEEPAGHNPKAHHEQMHQQQGQVGDEDDEAVRKIPDVYEIEPQMQQANSHHS